MINFRKHYNTKNEFKENKSYYKIINRISKNI